MSIEEGQNLDTTNKMMSETGGARYNLTLRRVRLAIVAVEKEKVLNVMSVCFCIIALVIPHEIRIFPICYYLSCVLSGCTRFFPHFL